MAAKIKISKTLDQSIIDWCSIFIKLLLRIAYQDVIGLKSQVERLYNMGHFVASRHQVYILHQSTVTRSYSKTFYVFFKPLLFSFDGVASRALLTKIRLVETNLQANTQPKI